MRVLLSQEKSQSFPVLVKPLPGHWSDYTTGLTGWRRRQQEQFSCSVPDGSFAAETNLGWAGCAPRLHESTFALLKSAPPVPCQSPPTFYCTSYPPGRSFPSVPKSFPNQHNTTQHNTTGFQRTYSKVPMMSLTTGLHLSMQGREARGNLSLLSFVGSRISLINQLSGRVE